LFLFQARQILDSSFTALAKRQRELLFRISEYLRHVNDSEHVKLDSGLNPDLNIAVQTIRRVSKPRPRKVEAIAHVLDLVILLISGTVAYRQAIQDFKV
jgi:hypothetical protein